MSRTKIEGSPVHLVIVDHDMAWTIETQIQLGSHPQLKVIGFAQNMATALERAVSMEADAVLTEFSMPDGTASELAKRLAEDSPGTAVFSVSSSISATLVQSAKAAGVVEIFPKQGFVAREAAERIVEHVDSLRREWSAIAHQYGAVGRGVGPMGQKTKVEYVTRSVIQTVILTHNTKGGVGKSTIACNLAVAIKMSPFLSSQRVCLVDFDCGGANASTNYHISDTDVFNRNLATWEYISEDISADEVDKLLIKGSKGVMVAAAPLSHAMSGRIGFDLAEKILRILKRYYGVIVIDGAPNLSDPVDAAMLHATHILMIANAEGQSVKQLSRIVSSLRPDPDYPEKKDMTHILKKMFLVLNYAQAPTPWDLKKLDVANTVGLPLFAEIPFDQVVRKALHGKTEKLAVELESECSFSLSIKSLANDICGAYPEGVGKKNTDSGLFKKLFKRG
jgi:pilus assembly protein CpaE